MGGRDQFGPFGVPQTPAMPAPPQVAGDTHVPHSSRPPQPLPAGPQLKPSLAHDVGAQLAASCVSVGSAQNPSMQEIPVVDPQQSLFTVHLLPSTAQPAGCVPQTYPPRRGRSNPSSTGRP